MIRGFRDCCRAVIFLIAICVPAGAEPLTVDLVSAELAHIKKTQEAIVVFRMLEASARKFADLTSKNIGKKLAIRVDGETLATPVIQSSILSGAGQISAPWTVAKASAVAEKLASGKGKLEFEIVP